MQPRDFDVKALIAPIKLSGASSQYIAPRGLLSVAYATPSATETHPPAKVPQKRHAFFPIGWQVSARQ
jgi:hypothetical protein